MPSKDDFKKEDLKEQWRINKGGAWDVSCKGLYKTKWMKDSIKNTIEALKLMNIKNVLEIGCFNGHHLKIFAKKFPEVDFLGIDISPHFIGMANDGIGKIKNISFELMDAEEMNFDREFDVVMAGDIICAYPYDGARDIFDVMCRATKKYLILEREFHPDFSSIESYSFMENYWCLSIHDFDSWFAENGFSLKKFNLGETHPTRGRLNAMLIGEKDV